MVSFLVDFLRFEAARSSKVAIFGLWIGLNTTLGWRELLWRVAKKKRKKSNKLAWFFLHAYPLFEKNCFESKYMSFYPAVLVRKKTDVVFIENIFRPLCNHFVGLSSPTLSLFIQKKSFFWQETNYLTLYEPAAGFFNLSRTCHFAPSWVGYCDVIDLSFAIYISMSP